MDSVRDWAEVGERVRAARGAADLSQRAVAERMGVDRTSVVKLEAGERGVSALELTWLAEILDVPIAYFVTRSPGPVVAYRSELVEAPDEAADRARFRLDVALEQHARDATWLVDQGFLRPDPIRLRASVSTTDEAAAAAREARRLLGIGDGPVGPLADTSERFGLFLKVATDGSTGASLQIDDDVGVGVVGGGADPGRRRWTAAHELGHHIFGDTYNTDAGVASSEKDRETLVDAFTSEFLLPASLIIRLPPAADLQEARTRLVELAGTYRLSWGATVNAARRHGRLDAATAQKLRASSPTKGDFVHLLGEAPEPDVRPERTGPLWRDAVLRAWLDHRITAGRTTELLAGALSEDELPQRDTVDLP